MKFNLYFVRHGETYLNKYERMQGWIDSPLTENGIENLKHVSDKLKSIQFSKIITSDLSRTIESAKIIASNSPLLSDVSIQSHKEFRETFFGGFEGESNAKVWGDILRKTNHASMEDMVKSISLSEVLDVFHESDINHEAENKNQFYERLQDAVKIIKEDTNEGDNILLVSHGNFIRHFIFRYANEIIAGIENSSCYHCVCDTKSDALITEVKKV